MPGPKKNYEFHFRVPEDDGERFLLVVARMGMVKSDVVREALLAFLALAESLPPDLERHKLAAAIEDAVARAVGTRAPIAPISAANGHPPTTPTRPEPARPRPAPQTHKRR